MILQVDEVISEMLPPLHPSTRVSHPGLFARIWQRLRPERHRPLPEVGVGRDLLAAAHVATVLSARTDSSEIARLGAYMVQETLGGSALVLLPDSSGRLRVQSYEGLNVDPTGLLLELPQGFFTWGRQEPLQFGDVRELGGTLPACLAAGAGIAGGILVPMVSQGQVQGAILAGHSEAHWYTPREVGMLTLVAAQMAQALENGRMRRELQEQARVMRTSQELSEQLLEHVGTGIMVVDPAYRVTLLNQAARETLAQLDGRTWEVGDQVDLLVELDHPVRQAIVQQFRGTRTVGYREFTLEIETSTMRGTYGERVGIMVLFRDVSLVQRMEQRMRRVERLAAIGGLAAAAAHEIRNPLTSIRGFIQLLQHRGAQQSDAYYGIVLREIDRIDGLIREMLLLAKPVDPRRQSIDLVALVEETLVLTEPSMHGRKVQVMRVMQGPLPLFADAHLIRQVLLNLIGNALDAMPDGGVITVSTARVGPHVQLWVRDTGHGIAPENLPRLFTPFFTTKENGTGLGLALCYRIIEAHGGRLDVESKVSVGTSFLVELPAEPPLEGTDRTG